MKKIVLLFTCFLMLFSFVLNSTNLTAEEFALMQLIRLIQSGPRLFKQPLQLKITQTRTPHPGGQLSHYLKIIPLAQMP